MEKESGPKLEEIIAQIEIVAQRMKDAKLKNDKVGYDLALKEHERLHKEYAHILYKKRDPSPVYLKRI